MTKISFSGISDFFIGICLLFDIYYLVLTIQKNYVGLFRQNIAQLSQKSIHFY